MIAIASVIDDMVRRVDFLHRCTGRGRHKIYGRVE